MVWQKFIFSAILRKKKKYCVRETKHASSFQLNPKSKKKEREEVEEMKWKRCFIITWIISS